MVMRYGNFLRQLRINSGLSILKISKLLGISSQYLSEIERGGRKPLSEEKTCLFAETLGISKEDTKQLISLRNEELNRVSVPDEVIDYLQRNPKVIDDILSLMAAG